ncbi:MAG: hypothetical protein N2484_04210 [Clostridia bacterium]|nr:hypothetical protein [Clostridia bacterium]
MKTKKNEMKDCMRKIALIILSTGVINLLAGCAFVPKEEAALAPPLKEPEKVTYNTIEIKKGTIDNRVSATGYFVSSQQTNLGFQFRGGYLKGIYVKTGSNVRTNHNEQKRDEDPSRNNDGKEDITVKKGDLLAELDSGSLENEIKVQDLELRKAEIQLEKLKTEYQINGGGDKYAIKQAEVEVELSKVKLNNLRTELQKSKLISPVSGIIDFIDETKAGEYINANKTFIRIVDPSQLVVESSENGVSSLKFGMKVEIEVKGRTYPGEVVMAPYDVSAKDYAKARDYGKEEEYTKLMEKLQNTVRVRVSPIPGGVVIGDPARISASLSKKENVLLVPKNVVHTFEGRKFVKVLKDDMVSEVDIETGLQSTTDYEVLKGLQEGDKVIK